MAGFFSPDSKLYQAMSRLTDIVKLNLLWLLFSLPVVTVGISTIAAYTVTLKMSEEREGRIAHDFVRAFKENWKQGIVMSFISIISVWAIYLDFQLADAVEENGFIFLIVGIITAYILIFSLAYAYPLLARYENTIILTLKNSFQIGMKYFVRTIVMLLIVAIELAVIFWNETSLFIGAIVGPAFIMFTVSVFAMKIFRELEKVPGAVTGGQDK
ncbi:MAG: YesL family protein [Oscillospiraceae bacterium]|nr:YesL family protein [Oscillospiraceae bacterium]